MSTIKTRALFPLHSNASMMLAGAQSTNLISRVKLASLLFDEVVLEIARSSCPPVLAVGWSSAIQK